MDFKNILVLVVVSFLLFGAVAAQKTVNDFEIGDGYNIAHNGTNYALYLNEKQDSGITVYKDLAGDVDDVDDAYDDLIHDEGRDYLTPDDDFKFENNSDKTVNFTDYDHAQHGVSEVIKSDGEQFIVVFWAKDTSDVKTSDLISQLNEFNKNNEVEAISF